jgi:Domain of unknown function (DU1801)
MPPDAGSVQAYLRNAPADHRDALTRVVEVIRARLPKGYEEGLQYGIISWYVPLSRYPNTYNGQALTIAALASKKRYMSLYLMGVYGSEPLRAWLTQAFRAAGKTLDMGKACVRFTTLSDLPLEAIGQVVSRISVDDYIAQYEQARAGTAQGRAKTARAAAKGARADGASKAAKPATKTPTTSTAKPTAKPAKKPTAKAAAKPPAKSAKKPTVKGATKKPAKPAAKRAAK